MAMSVADQKEPAAEPSPTPELRRVNSRGHSITMDVVDRLTQAFNLLHNHSLKHDMVQAIDDERLRKAARAASSPTRPRRSRSKLYRGASPAELAQSATVPQGLEVEPEVANKGDWAAWREWAYRRSVATAQLAHPRKQKDDGLLEPFRFSAPMNEIADVAGGVATQLYFDFLRLMGGVCMLGLIISTPGIVYSARYQNASLRSTGLLTSTDLFGYNSIAALSLIGRITCDAALAAAPVDADARLFLCPDLDFVNTLCCGLEIAFSFFLLAVIRAFRIRAQRLAAGNVTASRVQAQRYSVRLQGLPASATPLSIKAHIEGALGHWVNVRTAKLRAQAARRRGSELAFRLTAEADGLDALRASGGLLVHDACSVLQYGALLRAKMHLVPFEKRIDRARHALAKAKACLLRASMRNAPHPAGRLSYAVHSAQRSLDRALRRHDIRRAALAERSFSLAPCGAFVTFEREEGAAVCMQALRGGLPYLLQPCYLRYPLAGPPAAALASAEAEEEESRASFARVSMGSYDSELEEEGPVEPESGKPGTIRRRPSGWDKGEAKRENLREEAIAAYASREGTHDSRRLRAFAAPHPQDATFDNLPSDLTNLPAASAWGTLLRRVVARALLAGITAVSVSGVVLLHSLKTDVTGTAASLLGLNKTTGVDWKEKLTAEQVRQLAQYTGAEQALGMSVSIALVTFNSVITTVVGRVAQFERHPTFTRRETIKLFLLTFFVTANLGLVPLLVGAAIVHPQDSFGCWMGPVETCLESDALVCCLTGPKGFFFRGGFSEMEPRWYTDVGVLGTTTLLIEFIVTSAAPFIAKAKHRLKRLLMLPSRTTLADAAELFIGPKFDVPRRIGRAYAYLSVVLVLAVPVPLVYLLGLLYALGQYGVQKWSLLRLCRTPPTFDAELVVRTVGWLKLMVVLHLGIGCWAYGSPLVPGYSLNQALRDTLTPASFLNSTSDDFTTITPSLLFSQALESWGAAALAAATALVALMLLMRGLLAILTAALPTRELARLVSSLGAICSCGRRSARVAVSGVAHDDSSRLSPALSACIAGTAHPRLRVLNGRIYAPESVRWPTGCGVPAVKRLMAKLSPAQGFFRLCGLRKTRHSISPEEWLRAPPLRVRVTEAANLSYEPQFSPWYSHLFFVAEADAEDARRKRRASHASNSSDESVSPKRRVFMPLRRGPTRILKSPHRHKGEGRSKPKPRIWRQPDAAEVTDSPPRMHAAPDAGARASVGVEETCALEPEQSLDAVSMCTDSTTTSRTEAPRGAAVQADSYAPLGAAVETESNTQAQPDDAEDGEPHGPQ